MATKNTYILLVDGPMMCWTICDFRRIIWHAKKNKNDSLKHLQNLHKAGNSSKVFKK